MFIDLLLKKNGKILFFVFLILFTITTCVGIGFVVNNLNTNVLQFSFNLECFSYICCYDEKCGPENIGTRAGSMLPYEYHRVRCSYMHGQRAFLSHHFRKRCSM